MTGVARNRVFVVSFKHIYFILFNLNYKELLFFPS
jgi:hypothetical protein